jgi:2-isopropylmalate synthase
MGKHSGRHAFREKLGELGYTLDANKLDEAFRRFKDLADKKKTIFDEDIIAIVDDAAVRENQFVQFVSLQVRAGSVGPQTADIELNVDGQRCQAHAEGDGPVDATFKAIRDVFPHDARLDLYQVHAVTEGTDAQAEVTVRMSEQGRTVTGTGADTDTLVASARAYVNALNKLVVRREKMGAAELDAISAQ